MCGACPGGGRLSEGTQFLAKRMSPTRTAQLVSELTGGRLRIASLGDGWSVALPTGGMNVVTDFEGLVRLCRPFVRSNLVDDLSAAAEQRPDDGADFIIAAFTRS